MTIFHDAIESIFASWNALEHAVSQKTGGTESVVIARWMIDVTEQYFSENADLEPEEVADYLSEIMDQELNMLVDDGSDLEISSLLCRVYSYYKAGDTSAIQSIISGLPQLSPTTSNLPRQTQSDSDNDDEPSQSMECGALSQLASNVNMMNIEAPNGPSLSEIDGWTVVHKGRRK